MNICIYGLWHQGSVTSAGLAKLGHQVIGLDLDHEVIKGLQKAQAPLFEPGLNELISQQMKADRLSFSQDARKALSKAQVLWFAFDTPVNDKDVADIKFLENNFRKIMPYLKDGLAIVISSQAPVGFVNKLEKELKKKNPDKKYYFACTPENLRLGKALDAFLNPDRIVVGIKDQGSKAVFLPLFSSITDRLEWMSIPSAEMTKHAINSFLALSVCFANELAGICEELGVDAREVERGLKTEARIGPKAYLKPGVAFSGGTLARDINFLIKLSDQYKLPSYLIKAVDLSNSLHHQWIERKCQQSLKSLKGKTIAILGLSYKPGTDTLRRSFAIELAKSLHARGAKVLGFDPLIKKIPQHVSKIIELKGSITAAISHADIVIIAVECPEFLQTGTDIISLMKNKTIIDPNGFMAKLVEGKGLKYVSVGKKI